ncbi:MAG: NrdH-redoxin [Chloroflexi bacterium]|mgnify:CR=1 FL=1|nr:NrdH-redoxin [Chloroflexota bacterium]|tara:strand:+ start:1849 stop:2124 length:276 start_codon:yes stop_codon:yes gene_type:complete
MNSLVYPKILMYSRNFCSDCVRSKAFLDDNKIPYKEINILEDKKAQEKVIKINNGRATVPTIIINNSKEEIVLSEPSDSELAKAISKLSSK